MKREKRLKRLKRLNEKYSYVERLTYYYYIFSLFNGMMSDSYFEKTLRDFDKREGIKKEEK